MKPCIHSVFALIFLFLAWESASGQNTAEEDNFSHLPYLEAIKKYEKKVKREPENGIAWMNLGHAFRLNGETVKAQQAFAKASVYAREPRAKLYHAQMLNTNRKFAKAAAWFGKYADLAKDPSDASNAREMARIARLKGEGRRISGKYEVKKVPFNSNGLDFSPSFSGPTTLVFVSNRPGVTGGKESASAATGEKFTDLFSCEIKNDSSFSAESPLKGDLNGEYHEGPATFHANAKEMYFTRTDYRSKKRGFDRSENSRLLLCRGEKKEGGWTYVEELPFNSKTSSTCHPALSADGNTLVFASDRPGGLGGMDLYVVRRAGAKWSKPVNLGPKVNTPGNEIFPFIDKKGRLWFASDQRAGYGGLDIFMASPSGKSWDNPVNAGQPINGVRDDFGLIFNEQGTAGFLSSNRGGKDDDIYRFHLRSGLDVYGQVSHCEGKKGIAKAEVVFTLANGSEISTQSDKKGRFQLRIDRAQNLEISAKKEGFSGRGECDGKLSLSANEVKEGVISLLKLSENVEEIWYLSGQVLNKKYGNPLAHTEIILRNKCNGKETRLESDAEGKYKVEIKQACEYELKVNREKYLPETTQFTTRKRVLGSAFKVDISLDFDESKIPEPIGEDIVIKPGLVIELYHIYFDLDKDFIRVDALEDLETLHGLLLRYPNMKGELSAHTDSRASSDYNMKLSQRRAENAKKWLLAKGIKTDRLSTRGYGETQLKNECADGVTCTEKQHQRNRRVEFRVTDFDGLDVRSKEFRDFGEKGRKK